MDIKRYKENGILTSELTIRRPFIVTIPKSFQSKVDICNMTETDPANDDIVQALMADGVFTYHHIGYPTVCISFRNKNSVYNIQF